MVAGGASPPSPVERYEYSCSPPTIGAPSEGSTCLREGNVLSTLPYSPQSRPRGCFTELIGKLHGCFERKQRMSATERAYLEAVRPALSTGATQE